MNSANGRVLCLDDDAGIGRSLQWTLQRRFEVVCATQVDEAMEHLRTGEFDVAICDRALPTGSGIDFLARARQMAPRTMRLLLSGYLNPDGVRRAVNDCEVFRFVGKPWGTQQLRASVEAAVHAARSAPFVDPETPLDTAALAGDVLVIDDDPERCRRVANAVEGRKAYFTDDAAEAMAIICTQDIAAIVFDTAVRGFDVTPLICLLKEKRPDIVSILLTRHADADFVAGLINHGQVFRCLVEPGDWERLPAAIDEAVARHAWLKRFPRAAARYAVEPMPPGTAQSVLLGIERSAYAQGRTTAAIHRAGKIRSGFYRIFGPPACSAA